MTSPTSPALIVSSPWPPRSSLCLWRRPRIGVCWSCLWMMTLPSIFGHSLWLAFCAGAAAVQAVRITVAATAGGTTLVHPCTAVMLRRQRPRGAVKRVLAVEDHARAVAVGQPERGDVVDAAALGQRRGLLQCYRDRAQCRSLEDRARVQLARRGGEEHVVGGAEVAAGGERLAEGSEREGDDAADVARVGRGAHRERAVARKRLRPAQWLQAAPGGGALDAIEERLAVGGAAEAFERVGARQPRRRDRDPHRRRQQRDDALGDEIRLGAGQIEIERGSAAGVDLHAS